MKRSIPSGSKPNGKGSPPQEKKTKTNSISNQNPPMLHSVSPKSAKILKQIDQQGFTDGFLRSGIFTAKVLGSEDLVYRTILEYIRNSQPHIQFNVYLENVLEISRTSAPTHTHFLHESSPQLTMMLWHGTKPKNVAGIIRNGFICPTDGAQMFGQGIYFADRVSKSARFCNPCKPSTPVRADVGYLFLCEVDVGECYIAQDSDPTYTSVPTETRSDGSVKTFDSLKCTGLLIPDVEYQREIDGVVWPLGATVVNDEYDTYGLNYNEYVVYDPRQISIKYLVQVIFG